MDESLKPKELVSLSDALPEHLRAGNEAATLVIREGAKVGWADSIRSFGGFGFAMGLSCVVFTPIVLEFQIFTVCKK